MRKANYKFFKLGVDAQVAMHAAGTLRKACRGHSKVAKPTVQAVLDGMDLETTKKTKRRVGLLAQFPKVLKMPYKNPGGRSKTLNELLEVAGVSGRAYEAKVVGMPGREPWVASEDTFRALYHCL